MSDLCQDRRAIAGPRVHAGFRRREMTVEAGSERPYDPAEWFDSLVTVEHGEVALAGHAGDLARFRRGDILWLTGLPVRALRNPGPGRAVLVAVSRRDLAPPCAPGS